MIHTVKVPLGTICGSTKTLYLRIQERGVAILEAIPGEGKSTFPKRAIIELVRVGRPVIVFDPMSEYFTIEYVNFAAEYCGGVPNLKVVKNFAFPVSAFDSGDLSGLNLSEGAIAMLGSIVKNPELREYHHDDPDLIAEIIHDLPRNWKGKKAFEAKYGVFIDVIMHKDSYEALKFWFDTAVASRMFYDAKNAEAWGQVNMTNLKGVVGKGCTIFDLGMRSSEAGITKIRMNCGIILKLLRKIIEELNPVIIFEEADKLAPNGMNVPPSGHQIFDLCIKLQKLGVYIICITQNEDLLMPAISENCHQRIIGRLNPGSKNYHYVENIRSNPEFGIREFVLVRHNEEYRFRPFEPPFVDYGDFKKKSWLSC